VKLINASWTVPDHIKAVVTTRDGGVSTGPYQSLNLGDHVEDSPDAVSANRHRLCEHLGLIKKPQWLTQIHGTELVKACDDGIAERADACWTDEVGQACIVMTADCLPVFFTDRTGSRVAVAHAGWRGLADGVLEQTLSVFHDPSEVVVWFGPAIGPQAFEVGEEVRQQFCEFIPESELAFQSSDNAGKWLADIYQLARLRLNRAGVSEIFGEDYCTFTQSDLFFSYRRDGVTGRMASIIWIS